MLKNCTRVFLRTKIPLLHIIPSQPLWTAIKGEQYSDFDLLRLPACSRQVL